jgi:hypothetical protein
MSACLLIRVSAAVVLVATASAGAQVGPGGVVGGARSTTRDRGLLGPLASTAPVQPAVPIVLPKTFTAAPADTIERAEFMNKAKPIAKNITSATAMVIMTAPGGEIGLTADVIATVAAGSRQGNGFSAGFVKKQAEVGKEMVTSFEEAVRAVGMRYPKVEPGKIEFSFGDKYTPHEGGSAGTCFAVMLLSELEGFEIDPKVAVTGDITVDWKVRKIGGAAAKVRGAAADKCLYTGVPLENQESLNDMVLFYGDSSIRDIQVFTLTTLQDAVALMRKDRSPQLTEAMKEFDALAPRLKGGRGAYSVPANQKVLENIVALAPNHESARVMLQMAKGTFPKTLTPMFAFEQFFDSYMEYAAIMHGREPVSRQTVPAAQTIAVRKQLAQLAPLSPPELAPLVRDMQKIVDVCENIALGQAKVDALLPSLKAFDTDKTKLQSNKEFYEKLLRSEL